MDYLPTIETLSTWLLEYGSWTLFVLLALGIIAIPVPEETLMVVAGTLIAGDLLHPVWTLLAAYGGSICGITVSYFLGRTVGIFFIHKYGGWVGIKESHVNKVHVWFEKFGKWALFIGYFIPGVRHFTGFIAGSTDLNIRQFMLFAYSGALVWVSTFLSFGYFFGNYCIAHCSNIKIEETELFLIALFSICIAAGYFIFKKRRTIWRQK